MMNPFNQAWILLKMPIVPNSLKEREGGYTGQFEDPKTGEIKPLYIHGDYEDEVMTGSIPNSARADFTPLHPDTWMADDTATKEPFQRRGYMSAIYDAIASILNQKDAQLVGNPIQSEEGQQFWGDKETWPVREDL